MGITVPRLINWGQDWKKYIYIHYYKYHINISYYYYGTLNILCSQMQPFLNIWLLGLGFIHTDIINLFSYTYNSIFI